MNGECGTTGGTRLGFPAVDHCVATCVDCGETRDVRHSAALRIFQSRHRRCASIAGRSGLAPERDAPVPDTSSSGNP